ncbi:MAG: TonB-dependent receptor, partial [Gemmatimonadaceae bacterium]
NGSNEDHDNVTEYGAYVQSSTKPAKQLELLFAARGDANTVIKGSFFSPRAAVIIKPSETQNIRFTYNRAFATPANFSYFLDLINTPNIGGSGYDLKALGNPPKIGFTFRRGCTGSSIDDYCMKSKYVNGGAYTAATASSAFPGLITGASTALTGAISPSVIGALQAAGFSAAQAAALGPVLASGMIGSLAAARPTEAQISTRVSLLNDALTPLTSQALQPIAPLGASFNNTYEVGYKGIVGNRFRFDVSGWRQQRGDVGTSAALTTPNVFFNPTQLGGFIGSTLGAYLVPALMASGLTQAQAGALAGQLAPGVATALATQLAPAPLGVVTFDSPTSSATQIYAVYKNVNKKLWVSGLDLAVDYVATDRVTLNANYSYSNLNVFSGVDGGNGAPLMSNSPKNRGSVGSRMSSGQGGWGGELTLRYSDPFPVNSGVYASDVAFPIAAGQPGSITTVNSKNLGYGKCSLVTPGSGTYCYKGVPTSITVDAQITKKFDLGGRRFMASINATNLLNNKLNTFVGTPEIGRLVLTRLQYSF